MLTTHHYDDDDAAAAVPFTLWLIQSLHCGVNDFRTTFFSLV